VRHRAALASRGNDGQAGRRGRGARHAGTYGTEIFGGYGICNEYPVSMFTRDAYQIQFSPISNEMSRNMLMQFQGLPKSWA
jgi:acyl-CoA dehydrogenase